LLLLQEGILIEAYSTLSSVELLYLNDENISNDQWLLGPELPNNSVDATMFEHNITVILIGGTTNPSVTWNVDSLNQLSSPEGPWIEMKQKLKKERRGHISFHVPDEILNCLE